MSIFNFKKRADEPYELGELIGVGSTCNFYKIKNDNLLGIKIHNDKFRIISEKNQINNFLKEIEIGNFLRRHKIPVPIYVGIIDIINCQKNIVQKGLAMEIIGDELKFSIHFPHHRNNNSQKYFTIDEIKIILEKKLNITYERRLDFELVFNVKTLICEILNLMIDNLNLTKLKIMKYKFDWQGIYSPSNKKFYLIDFELWEDFL